MATKKEIEELKLALEEVKEVDEKQFKKINALASAIIKYRRKKFEFEEEGVEYEETAEPSKRPSKLEYDLMCPA